MATKFTFTLESDGLNIEQAATFASFVKSLQVQSAEIPFNYAAIDEAVDAMAAPKMESQEPAKKKRAPKLSVAAGSGTIEDAEEKEEREKFLAEEKADRDAQEKGEYEAKIKLAKAINKAIANDHDEEETEEAVFAAEIKSITLDTLKKLVGEKQAKHRDEIKEYFLKKGGYKTTTLPDELYEEFHDLLSAMD